MLKVRCTCTFPKGNKFPDVNFFPLPPAVEVDAPFRDRCLIRDTFEIPHGVGLFSKILTGKPLRTELLSCEVLSCEVLSPCDRRGIHMYVPKKKTLTKVQKHFFLLIFVECRRACSEATSRSYCPGLGTQKITQFLRWKYVDLSLLKKVKIFIFNWKKAVTSLTWTSRTTEQIFVAMAWALASPRMTLRANPSKVFWNGGPSSTGTGATISSKPYVHNNCQSSNGLAFQ